MTPAATVDTPAYAGRATIHFHEAKHYYTVSVPSLGKSRVYQPGVTSIIKMKDKSGPLCWWTAEQCEIYARQKVAELGGDEIPVGELTQILGDMRYHYRDVARRAANVGTLVHEYLHRHLEHVTFGAAKPEMPVPTDAFTEEMCEQAENAIGAGLQFFEEHELKPLTMEQPVWSATHGYVGTDDFIGTVDGEMCTCDYKTSKSLYPEVWLQTAAYQNAYQEEHPRAEIKARWGINISKDGSLFAQRRGPESYEEDLQTFLALLNVWRWDRKYGNEAKGDTEIIGALPEVGWLEELAA